MKSAISQFYIFPTKFSGFEFVGVFLSCGIRDVDRRLFSKNKSSFFRLIKVVGSGSLFRPSSALRHYLSRN